MYTNGVSRELLAILDVSAKSDGISRVYLMKYIAIHYKHIDVGRVHN